MTLIQNQPYNKQQQHVHIYTSSSISLWGKFVYAKLQKLKKQKKKEQKREMRI